ncbi:MAG TPA: hypothetical protein VFG30_39065 [Polyangiales bacterium]|nr:hypothetical protein [Polyangiales bacterium]
MIAIQTAIINLAELRKKASAQFTILANTPSQCEDQLVVTEQLCAFNLVHEIPLNCQTIYNTWFFGS